LAIDLLGAIGTVVTLLQQSLELGGRIVSRLGDRDGRNPVPKHDGKGDRE
jgi:hypothetical protein